MGKAAVKMAGYEEPFAFRVLVWEAALKSGIGDSASRHREFSLEKERRDESRRGRH
jgi:hypothetical protein